MDPKHAHELNGMCSYDLLRQLKAVTGWTLAQIAEQTDLSHDAVKYIHRKPGYKGSEKTRGTLKKFLLEQQPANQTYSESVDVFHRQIAFSMSKVRCDPIKQRTGKIRPLDDDELALAEHLEHVLRPAIKAHPAWGTGGLDDLRLQWAYGHTWYQSLRLSGYSDLDAYNRAQQAYNCACRILLNPLPGEQRNMDVEEVAFKIEANGFAMLLNMCDRNTRRESPEVRAWLNDYRFLDKNLAAIKSAPWDLALMRQALVAASILQARPAAEMLVVMIKKLCADFFEPGIAPLPGLEPAFSDPDFTWLYEEKIHLLSPESQDARHDQQSGSAANAQQRM